MQTVETELERGRAGSEALDADARERGPEARLESVRGQCNGRPPAGAVVLRVFRFPDLVTEITCGLGDA